jgi:hypothetical protein
VFRDLVLARIIKPTSKADSLRVLAETGIEPVDYRTVTLRLPKFAKPAVRQALSAACAARAELGPTSLVPHDLYRRRPGTGLYRAHIRHQRTLRAPA